MEKAKSKARDIQFYSEKNQKTLCVHSKSTRMYADYLEQKSEVIKYEVCSVLDQHQYCKINPIGIRKDYFSIDWATDFILHFSDGRFGIREIVSKEQLTKRASIEKLEFSRRYWSVTRAINWKIVVI